MPSLIRVLLIDDNPEFLRSAHDFLALLPSLQVVGCALSGTDALRQISCLLPQLVLVDWAMPGLSGLETTRLIKAVPNAPLVVILTLYSSSPYRTAAQLAGADGILDKVDWYAQLPPLLQQLFPDGLLSP